MNNIRLLPIVIMSIGALLVLKTVGLVTNGGYVLTGTTQAMAAGGGSSAPTTQSAGALEPTIADQTPTISVDTPTLAIEASTDRPAPAAQAEAAAEAIDIRKPIPAHELPRTDENLVAEDNACAPISTTPESDGKNPEGELVIVPPGCPLPEETLPQIITATGKVIVGSGITETEQALLERLGERRSELEAYEQELAMRASLVTAAEQRIQQRQETLESIEAQIASLVEQRKEMEAGQFAAIVAMYETMKPKDAANIFNALDIDVLLRVAKMMSPRKMAPILAEMNTARAQELTVRLAANSVDPLETMSPDDLAALPQIIGH